MALGLLEGLKNKRRNSEPRERDSERKIPSLGSWLWVGTEALNAPVAGL